MLISAVGDSWWRETTLLYTAQSDADPIVRACLKSATVPALALAFDCTEQQDRELDPKLSNYLNELLDQDQLVETAPGSTTSYNQGLALNGFAALDRSVGYALASSVYTPPDYRQWLELFSHAFLESVNTINPNGKPCVVSPDSLRPVLNDACDTALNVPGIGDDLWSRQVLVNLRETAMPVVCRDHAPSPQVISAVRLAALCLAVDAHMHKAARLAAEFRAVAAGITLLERRSNSDSTPTETIMLASS